MTSEKIQISIIMAVHDQAEELERNLPQFLTPQGDISYEVIVVDDASGDETPDVLTRMKVDNPQLYTTFLPFSDVPVPSRLRLALTVGVKASHGKWIIVADISRPPMHDNWLEQLAASLDDSYNVILGYDDKQKTIQAFDSVDEATPLVCKAERRSGRGHRGRHLLYRRGIYNVLMVRHDYIHDVLKLFDNPVKGSQLTGLRFQVLFNNFF